MEIQHCVRCGKGLKAPQGINQTGDRAFSFFLSSVTVGIRPRIKSRAQRQVFCISCGISIAFAPAPEGAFNQSVWEVLRDMVSRDSSLLSTAWEQLVNPRAKLRRMPGSKPDKAFDLALPEPTLVEAPIAANG